jgi:hypothetical protein
MSSGVKRLVCFLQAVMGMQVLREWGAASCWQKGAVVLGHEAMALQFCWWRRWSNVRAEMQQES